MSVPTLVPAAQYLRVSTEHQQYSLDHQAQELREYAEKHGFQIVRTYLDEGRSGVRARNRPALLRLVEDVGVSKSAFRAVLVYDVSRWGRFQNCDEAAYYEFICKSAGAPVYYCSETFLNDDSLTSSVMKALKRSMAAEYSREMGIRIFAGSKRLAELGLKQGGKSGYGLRRLMISAEGARKHALGVGEIKSLRTDRVILIPGPNQEVNTVREIYRLLVEDDKSPSTIADELNKREVACPTGKWARQIINRILTDPKYAGFNVWNRTSNRLGTPRRTVPKSQWITIPGAFEAVIPADLFLTAQAVLHRQREPFSDEELLSKLRIVLAQHGSLSYSLLKQSRCGASINTFIKHFGTLRHAFELAGHNSRLHKPTGAQTQQAMHIRKVLIEDLTSRFPERVAVPSFATEIPEYLEIDGSLRVSVVVCPAVKRPCGDINWFIDRRWTSGSSLTLLATLVIDNTRIRELYVLPTPTIAWIRRRRDLKQAKRAELSHFCEAACDLFGELSAASRKRSTIAYAT